MSAESAVATLNPTDELMDELENDLQEIEATEPNRSSKKGRKSAEEKQAAKESAIEAERARVQALVPWKVLAVDPERLYYNNQRGEIDQWADDSGEYPRRYRSYTREEWSQSINLLAEAVSGLLESHPDYQRKTGLYVEELGTDLLLINSKTWQLLIQIPTKSSPNGKKIELRAAPGKDNWSGRDERPEAFVDLLVNYVPADDRDTLLDICCQYMRDVRIRVNKVFWAAQNPDLAHLLNDQRR